MSNRLTCIEVLWEIKKTKPDDIYLVHPRGSDREVLFLKNAMGTWDVFVFRSHGFEFSVIGLGFTNEGKSELVEKFRKL